MNQHDADKSSASSQAREVQTRLLENALDFLLSAAEAVRRNEKQRSLKEAVLHLANGTELLIKARLAQEHWSLIFSNTDKASHQNLADADFDSVKFENAVTRLEKIAQVPIHEPVISHVKDLRNLRNRLTHFTETLDPAGTKSLVAKSMKFCVEFCEQQGMSSPEAENKLGEILTNLAVLQEFVDDRLKTISKEWGEAFVWDCGGCWQPALIINGGEANCKFCNQQSDPEHIAGRNSEVPPEDCPKCGRAGTFAFMPTYLERDGWICFACGLQV